MVAQLEVERTDVATVAELLANPGVLNENRVVLASMQSARKIDHGYR